MLPASYPHRKCMAKMSVTDAGQWTNNERTLKIELLGQQWKLDAVFRNEKINFFYNLPSICCEFESAGKIFVFKVKVIVQKPSEHHRGNIGEHWHRTTREWKGFLSLPSHMAMLNIPSPKPYMPVLESHWRIINPDPD